LKRKTKLLLLLNRLTVAYKKLNTLTVRAAGNSFIIASKTLLLKGPQKNISMKQKLLVQMPPAKVRLTKKNKTFNYFPNKKSVDHVAALINKLINMGIKV